MAKSKIINYDHKKDYITDNNSELGANQKSPSPSTPNQQEKQILLYQLWPSTNTFICDGRFIQSLYPRPFIFSITLIFVPSILHIILEPIYGIYQILLTFLTYVFMFITAFSDPGIVPRVDNILNDSDLDKIPSDRSNEKKGGFISINSDGYSFSIRVCDTCGIYKDNNRKHCRICDNCISEFDHHCIWLNNCIGKNNYRTFILFLFFLLAQLIFTIVTPIIDINEKINENEKNYSDRTETTKNILNQEPFYIFLIVYSLIFLILVGILFSFHIYLILNNTNTFEFKKILSFKRQKWLLYFKTPYLLSIKRKLFVFSKSLINFRETVKTKKLCNQSKIVISNQIKKDSESATQIANIKEPMTNRQVDNLTQGQIHVKEISYEEFKEENQKIFSKSSCIEEKKEGQNNQNNNQIDLNKPKSLQIIEIDNIRSN